LWQVPSDARGEYDVLLQLNAGPFAVDNSGKSTITF
jgi:hypothetical protein